MSIHKIPLTGIEREGLVLHGLPVEKPSQLSDCFRFGMKWSESKSTLDIKGLVDKLTYKQQKILLTELIKRNRIAVHVESYETTY